MSLMMPGVYIGEVEEKSYEIATTYQLSYYVSSALITLDLIRDPDEDMLGRFSCVARYYRYYVDHLFYLLGQISSRFMKKGSRKMSAKPSTMSAMNKTSAMSATDGIINFQKIHSKFSAIESPGI